MKKTKIILIVIISIVAIIGTVLLLKNNKTEEEKVSSTLIIDINPSVEISLTETKIIKKIVALNDDAKGIINDVEGKNFEDGMSIIVDNLLKNNYIEDKQAMILLHVDGQDDHYEEEIRRKFQEKDIYTDIIVINEITDEDKEIAKKYNISDSKAAYINSIVKKDNIDIELLYDRSIRELQNTKEHGWYCEKGYTVDGAQCLKEIERVQAKQGKVCSEGYYEYNGKCYEEKPIEDTDNLKCRDGYTLKDNKCYRTETFAATPDKQTCSKGQLKKKSDIGLAVLGSGDDAYVCADMSSAKEPVLRCLYNTGHIMINGKCYNGPAPTINGGCPNGDTLRNGWCYSLDTYDQYQCPDGRIYEKSKGSVPKYCPDTIKTTSPIVSSYTCPEGSTLNGSKCNRELLEEAERERACPTGFNKVNNDRCININNTKEKQDGYVCEQDNSRLKGTTCIIYEIVEAKRN